MNLYFNCYNLEQVTLNQLLNYPSSLFLRIYQKVGD
jgi:hypothetical protein